MLPNSVFATENGDIFVDNSLIKRRIEKWIPNQTNSTTVMLVDHFCFAIFIDMNNTIYCSLRDLNRIDKKYLGSGLLNDTQTVIGINGFGITIGSLWGPHGIFIPADYSIYVADCYNHRIQRFEKDTLNASILAGDGAPSTISLLYPTGVILDGHGYIFIVDCWHHRIVASGQNGFRCLAGCNGIGNSVSQLSTPTSMAFDSYGNIFVADSSNGRVQKFFLASNSCSKYRNFLCLSAINLTFFSLLKSRFFESTKVLSVCFLGDKCNHFG